MTRACQQASRLWQCYWAVNRDIYWNGPSTVTSFGLLSLPNSIEEEEPSTCKLESRRVCSIQISSNPAQTANAWVKDYKVTNHLGSIRVTLIDPPFSSKDCQPFGKAVTGALPRQGYIEKEVDHENAMGDFGVRKYDAGMGRFQSVDRMFEAYRSISPYVYGNNNPISVTDPSGDSLNFTESMNTDTWNQTDVTGITKVEAEQKSGLTLSFNKDNRMLFASDANGNPIFNGGSPTYRNQLIKAITCPDIISVGQQVGGESGTVGNDIVLDPQQIQGFIDGSVGVDKSTMGYGMTLMHEIHHTKAMGGATGLHEWVWLSGRCRKNNEHHTPRAGALIWSALLIHGCTRSVH